MKKQELDTSWFDLKNYEKLKELNLCEWVGLLTWRGLIISVTPYNFGFFKVSPVNKWIIESANKSNKSETFSVQNMTVADIGVIQQSEKLNNALQIFDELTDSDFNNFLRQYPNLRQQQSEYYKQFLSPISSFFDNQMHYVSVNLKASDEQIMSDFRQWLSEYRKITGIEQPIVKKRKNPLPAFTNNDLSRWVEYRVLPYIDLTMIAQLEGKEMTYPKIANLIFPDVYDVDIVERVKKTTKPEADRLIKLFSYL